MSIPVTIVIPTYNAASTLVDALASIREHAPGAEVIVVDGDSEDDTAAVIKDNADVVTRFVSEPDSGVYDAMNKGLALATRTWFYDMGADDELLPGFASAVAQLDDPDTFYYGRIWLRHHDHAAGGPYTDLGLMTMWPHHQALIAPTAALRELGGFDLRYHVAADWALQIRAWDGGAHWHYHGEVICKFNELGWGSESGPDPAFRHDRLLLFYRHLSRRALVVFLATTLRYRWLRALASLRRLVPARRRGRG